jgi:phosphoribosylamine---glycine ligase
MEQSKWNVLLIGSGGREHALAWKLAQSPLLNHLYIAPGNGGTAAVGKNVTVDWKNFDVLRDFLLVKKIGMVVVGPEDPLVAGIYDRIKADSALAEILVVGPSAPAARLEGSKAHAKQFMKRYGIPTAAFGEFEASDYDAACQFLSERKPPYVLKADGLAAGKGVLIVNELEEAKVALKRLLDGQFGAASTRVVIEDFLAGTEFSVFALTDGKRYLLLPEAKDYKRIGEGDTGLNTGGMGAVSPVPFFSGAFREKTIKQIIEPTIKGLALDGFPYVGFVFFGLIAVDGEPMVIEYNVRMGDPETEVVIPRMNSDLLQHLIEAATGRLGETPLEISPNTATTVMVVSEGYPEEYEKGYRISGLVNMPADVLAFHAGTQEKDSEIITAGGRVMAFTGFGDDIQTALNKSYLGIGKICYEGITFRRDIGQDLLKKVGD